MADRARGHETRDVSIRALLLFGAALALGVLFAVFLALVTEHLFSSRHPKVAGPFSPLARPQLPPEPRLQTTPPLDLRALRAHEDEVLGHYGWLDRTNGVVRIPIEEAKRTLLERGLPVRPVEAPATAPAGQVAVAK